MTRARRRDRRVYLAAHPVLFGLLALLRRRPVVRLGGTVVVSGTEAFRDGLTRIPLDRAAAGTTGGAARELAGAGLLFDQSGTAHRTARRDTGRSLATVDRFTPLWSAVLARHGVDAADVAALARHRTDTVDVVAMATELAGVTAAALVGAETDPVELATAALAAAAAAARDHLPTLRRRGTGAQAATDRLIALLPPGSRDARTAMVVVAAVNTTVAAIPRAVAWCADASLWHHVAEGRVGCLVDELLRVIAPTPLLPRVAAAPGSLGGVRIQKGDRLILVTRHAVKAHRIDPDPAEPAPAAVSQLVFGAGSHACPGSRLAREQLAFVLRALAPHRPVVVAARAARHSALPGWASLTVRATT